MSVYTCVTFLCALAVCHAVRDTQKHRHVDHQVQVLKIDSELRGAGANQPTGGVAVKEKGQVTVLDPNITDAGGAKDSKEKQLKIGKNGSPTNEDIDKVDKAIKKHSPIHNLPLPIRLCLVALILAIPLVIISACVKFTPAEELASSVYVKTALHCGFSFTVGWLNCIMLLRYRVFATMMVGNTILMGVAFVCNGGFGQAKDYEGAWWMGEKAQVLCPAQFSGAGHYAIMICLFLVGSSLQGFLFKKFGWSSRPFAPIIAAGIIAVEMLEYSEVIRDSKLDVYLLSPIFGMFVSISAHGGVGSVPWAATGHMVSMGFKFGSWCSDFNHAELKSVFQNACLWTTFVLGIMMGTLFHSNRTVMLCALSLQGLLIINGIVFPNAIQISKSASAASFQQNPSDVETEPAKLPSTSLPDTSQGSMFVPRQQSLGYGTTDKTS